MKLARYVVSYAGRGEIEPALFAGGLDVRAVNGAAGEPTAYDSIFGLLFVGTLRLLECDIEEEAGAGGGGAAAVGFKRRTLNRVGFRYVCLFVAKIGV